MKPGLALLGLDPRVLALGRRALEHNVPILGIWAPDHNQALLASLQLGCCAFPCAEEPVSQAGRLLYSELPASWVKPLEGGLDVNLLECSSTQIKAPQLSADWVIWLEELGFEVVSPG